MKKMKLLVTIIAVISAMCCFADKPQPPSPSAPDGSIGGYDYVDLGLPSGTLWATYNVGASSPYEYGDYFAWGEVATKDEYMWENYEYVGEFIFDTEHGTWFSTIEIGDEISGTEYDAARHVWGGPWRLPTAEDIREMTRLCWHIWTTENGVRGVRVYGPNEHSIFFPAGGYASTYYGQTYFAQGYYGYYWGGTQTRMEGMPQNCNHRAAAFDFDSGGINLNDTHEKEAGHNIRPITTRKELTSITPAVNSEYSISICYEQGCLKVFGNIEDVSHVQVTDLYGRTVFVGAVDSGSCTLPTMSNGVYLVTISDGDTFIQTQKVIIKL